MRKGFSNNTWEQYFSKAELCRNTIRIFPPTPMGISAELMKPAQLPAFSSYPIFLTETLVLG